MELTGYPAGGPVRVLAVVGTRPEVIKLAPMVRYFASNAMHAVELVTVSTGQHTDLLDIALSDFGIRLTWRADPIEHGGSLSALLEGVIHNVTAAIRDVNPRLVVVQGDTTSAFGAALAAFNARLPVCHVEAGLRSFHQWEPFPEEMNRRLLSRISSFHFATTPVAKANLIQEGIEPVRIFPVQNPVHDTLAWTLHRLEANDEPLSTTDSVLITVHRREDRRTRLEALAKALSVIGAEHPSLAFMFVWHPSLEGDRDLVRQLQGMPSMTVTEPLPYRSFVHALARARVVLTDSGGVSEEAALLGLPLVVFRRLTEREDLVQSGAGVPVGVHADGVVEGLRLALEQPPMPHLAIPPAHVGRTIGRTIIDLILPALGDIEFADLR